MARFRMIRELQVQSATAAASTANDVLREREKMKKRGEGWLRLRALELFRLVGVNRWVEVTAGWTFKYKKIKRADHAKHLKSDFFWIGFQGKTACHLKEDLPRRWSRPEYSRQQWWAQSQHVGNRLENASSLVTGFSGSLFPRALLSVMNHIQPLLLCCQLWARMHTLKWMCDDVASILLLRAQCRGTEMSVNRCMLGYFQLRSPNSQSWKDTYVSSCGWERTDGAWLTAQMWMAACVAWWCVFVLENLPWFSQ